jgi:hypothetical protein
MRRILFSIVLPVLAGCCACPATPPYDPQTGALSLPTVYGAAAPTTASQSNHEGAHAK